MKGNISSIVAFVLAIAVLLSAGYFAITMTAEKLSQPERDYLIIGTNTPFSPFEIKNGERVIGFDIDLAERISAEIGKRMMIKDFNEFDSLLPNLQSGNLDMVVSAVTINDGRSEIVNFSDSYYNASQAVLVKRGGKNYFQQSCAPENFSGLRVGYQKGTTSQIWAEKNLPVNSKSTVFDDIPFAIQLLRIGSLDAILIDDPVAENIAVSNPDLTVAGTIKTDEKYGIAVQKGDPKNLLPTINKTIAEMRKNGEYQGLVKFWFRGEK